VGAAALGGGEQFKVLLKAAGFSQADQRQTQRGRVACFGTLASVGPVECPSARSST